MAYLKQWAIETFKMEGVAAWCRNWT